MPSYTIEERGSSYIEPKDPQQETIEKQNIVEQLKQGVQTIDADQKELSELIKEREDLATPSEPLQSLLNKSDKHYDELAIDQRVPDNTPGVELKTKELNEKIAHLENKIEQAKAYKALISSYERHYPKPDDSLKTSEQIQKNKLVNIPEVDNAIEVLGREKTFIVLKNYFEPKLSTDLQKDLTTAKLDIGLRTQEIALITKNDSTIPGKLATENNNKWNAQEALNEEGSNRDKTQARTSEHVKVQRQKITIPKKNDWDRQEKEEEQIVYSLYFTESSEKIAELDDQVTPLDLQIERAKKQVDQKNERTLARDQETLTKLQERKQKISKIKIEDNIITADSAKIYALLDKAGVATGNPPAVFGKFLDYCYNKLHELKDRPLPPELQKYQKLAQERTDKMTSYIAEISKKYQIKLAEYNF